MNRPMYESSRDRANERSTIESYCRAHGDRVHALKMPVAYQIDWGVFHDDSLLCWAECKRRNVPKNAYATFMVSLHKYMAGMDLSRVSGKPFLLIVEWNDGIGAHVCDGRAGRDIRPGGRRDRGDWQDIEPVVHIPVEYFFEVPKHG